VRKGKEAGGDEARAARDVEGTVIVDDDASFPHGRSKLSIYRRA
jgi:hypothetical protein